jgi:hypothetical protein
MPAAVKMRGAKASALAVMETHQVEALRAARVAVRGQVGRLSLSSLARWETDGADRQQRAASIGLPERRCPYVAIVK